MRTGDVFSIDTPTGTAYFQFVKKLALMGSVIRVLPGTYGNTPDLDALVEQPTNFWIFFLFLPRLNKGLSKKLTLSKFRSTPKSLRFSEPVLSIRQPDG